MTTETVMHLIYRNIHFALKLRLNNPLLERPKGMIIIFILQRIVDKRRRIQFSLKLRGEKLAEKVLFSECDGGILLEPYDEDKAKLPEYVEGHFGTHDRLTLPRVLSKKFGIGKAVTFIVQDDNTVMIRAHPTCCLVCGGTEHLLTIGNRTDRYICDNCFRPKA